MIAYVFWHHRRPEVPAGDYDDALRRFHLALLEAAPRGLQRTMIFRLPSAPWLACETGVYEDWHLFDDSGALDVVNEAAVSGTCREPHHGVAALVGGATAGLYSLRIGTPAGFAPSFAHWLSKPTGMTYESFFDTLRPACAGGAVLWGRRMVLGPTPEFCLHTAGAVELPYPALAVRLTEVLDGHPPAAAVEGA